MNIRAVRYRDTTTVTKLNGDLHQSVFIVPRCGHLVLAFGGSGFLYDQQVNVRNYNCCECDNVSKGAWEKASCHFGGCCHAY